MSDEMRRALEWISKKDPMGMFVDHARKALAIPPTEQTGRVVPDVGMTTDQIDGLAKILWRYKTTDDYHVSSAQWDIYCLLAADSTPAVNLPIVEGIVNGYGGAALGTLQGIIDTRKITKAEMRYLIRSAMDSIEAMNLALLADRLGKPVEVDIETVHRAYLDGANEYYSAQHRADLPISSPGFEKAGLTRALQSAGVRVKL